MNQLLMSLGGLTLGGSAVILVLALAGRSTRARYGARWRCWAWALLCLRLAQYETRYTSAREALLLAAEAKRGFGVRQRNGDPAAGPLLAQADALAAELLARPQPKAAYNTEPSQMG